MKKTFATIAFILTGMLFALSGCSVSDDITKDFISDGDFVYYYLNEEDGYAVVDVTEQGSQKDALAIPPYFNGKIVSQMGYIKYPKIGFATTYYSIKEKNILADTIFIPYTIQQPYQPFPDFRGNQKLYFPSCTNREMVDYHVLYYLSTGGSQCDVYISVLGYEALQQLLSEEIESVKKAYNSCSDHIHIANTAYLFNYEEAPNEGYFFINDFERGGTIENTPYQPLREGYTFGGWYKEAECRNEWNFEQDTLPEAEYDEEGNLIFVETRLYAKWYQN